MTGRAMPDSPDHGPVISDAEYERRIAALYEGLPPLPSREIERGIRRRELDILIDHRLGSRFPRERRDALWEAQQRVEKRRLRLGLHAFVKAILPGGFERHAQGLAGFVVREFGKVLDEAELRRFFDVGAGRPAALPFDRPPPKRGA